MAIPTIYTGKHQAQPKLGVGAVLAPVAETVLSEMRRRELKREKNEAEFLNRLKLENPYTSISNATNNRNEQDYSDFVEWSTNFRAENQDKLGGLTPKQNLELENKRTEVQNKIARSQQIEQQLVRDMTLAMKDPDRWDLSAANEAYKAYIEKGEYINPLTPRSISAAEFYSQNPLSKDYFDVTETAKKVGDKETKVRTTSLDINSPAFVSRVQADLFSNQGMIKGAVENFAKLPESKQKEYFKMAQENGTQMQADLQDLDGNGMIDARDNAVFLSHLDNVYNSLPLSKQTKEDIQSKSGGLSIGFGQGKTKGNSFTYSEEVQGSFAEGKGKGLEFTAKTGFDFPNRFLKDASGNTMSDMPETVNVKPLRLKDGKLEVEVTYKPKQEKGVGAFSLESLSGTPTKVTETMYIDYNDVSSKLIAEYPDIKAAVKKYGLSKPVVKKKKKIDWK